MLIRIFTIASYSLLCVGQRFFQIDSAESCNFCVTTTKHSSPLFYSIPLAYFAPFVGTHKYHFQGFVLAYYHVPATSTYRVIPDILRLSFVQNTLICNFRIYVPGGIRGPGGAIQVSQLVMSPSRAGSNHKFGSARDLFLLPWKK